MKDSKKSASDYARDFRKAREQSKTQKGKPPPANPRINENYKPSKN